nr:hypothetical protein [Tanacetum cinerariifolium]
MLVASMCLGKEFVVCFDPIRIGENDRTKSKRENSIKAFDKCTQSRYEVNHIFFYLKSGNTKTDSIEIRPKDSSADTCPSLHPFELGCHFNGWLTAYAEEIHMADLLRKVVYNAGVYGF